MERLEGRVFLSSSPALHHDAAHPAVVAAAATSPSIKKITPASGATNVAVNAYVGATLNLPNSGLDANTINASNVYLVQSSTARGSRRPSTRLAQATRSFSSR